jgi:hypothetical protein
MIAGNKSFEETLQSKAESAAQAERPEIISLGRVDELTFGTRSQITDEEHRFSTLNGSRRFRE